MVVRLRCAALLWPFLVSPERDVPFQVLPPCLIQNFLFPFLTNSLGEWARAGSLSKHCSNPAKVRGEGEKKRERKIFCRRLPSDIPLHVLFFPPLRGWVILWWELKCAFPQSSPHFEDIQVLTLTSAHFLTSSACTHAIIHSPSSTFSSLWIFVDVAWKTPLYYLFFYFKSSLFRAHLWVAASLRSFGLFSELSGLFNNFVKNSTCNQFFLGPCDTEPLCIHPLTPHPPFL